MFIKEAKPKIIKNSRKEESIEITIKTYEGTFKASPPAGKSRGKNEVEPYNLAGIQRSMKLLQGFCKAIKHKNFIIKKVTDLETLDKLINKFEERYGYLGGNVRYAIHTAFLRAAAKDLGIELWELIHKEMYPNKKPTMPMPVGNCIGGGLHSQEKRGEKPDFQEFLLIPKEKTFSKAITTNLRAYQHAKTLLHAKKRNDENAWRTNWTNEEVLEVLQEIKKKYNVRIGLDIAASTFHRKGYYYYKNKELIRDKVDQAEYIEQLIKKYGIYYVEDPMQEEDFTGFKEILNTTTKNKQKTLIVGDDLTTTNPKILRRAVQGNAINAIIIKPNQIGSMLEVKKVVEYCNENNITMIFSHRSGETMDTALADYCVGFQGQYMKAGIYGKERLIKLKRVTTIEKQIEKQYS